MSSRLEREEATLLDRSDFLPNLIEPVGTLEFEPEGDTAPALPADHPAWVKDAVFISQRARHLMAELKPLIIRVYTYWDHRIRTLSLGSNTLVVDVAGCYRM